MRFEPRVILGNQSSTIQDRCFCVILSVGEPVNAVGVEAAAEGVPELREVFSGIEGSA